MPSKKSRKGKVCTVFNVIFSYIHVSDSKSNNYEPVPVNEGSADFYWTTPAELGDLIMRFVITDESGMETVKELSFTFIEY